MPITSWDRRRVHGTWVDHDGTKLAGKYTVTVPTRLTNSTDDVIIPAGTYATGTLNTAPGVPSLDVLCPSTDDPDIEQTGWLLEIKIEFDGKRATEQYAIVVPIDSAEVNLREIALTAQLPTQAATYGVGRPLGLALLDADGQVVNAYGKPVIPGGGGGGASSWDELSGKPEVIAAGATAAVARAAIGALSQSQIEDLIDEAGGGGGAPGDWAGLNTAGIGRAIFIPHGGTIPPDLPDYTIVIELPED